MDIKNETYSDDSNLKISEDVIATIVAATAKDVAGVHAMAATPGKDVKRLFGKKGEGNGMTVTFIDGGAKIELAIIVRFGVKVNEVAANVQQRVKEAVETMTGIAVVGVDVTVAGMKLEAENKGKESK